MKIGFDHCFQTIGNTLDYFRLKERGFSLDAQMFEHPGPVFCRFIKFTKDDKISGTKKFHYLEFVEGHSIEAFKKITDPPVTSDHEALRPGFSLNCSENMKLALEKASAELAKYSPKYEHKNYNWKEDSTNYNPGWNFLRFEQSPVPNIFVWCTEYEPLKNPPPASELPAHPNSAVAIQGFAWDVSVAELSDLQKFCQAKVDGGVFQLQDNLPVFSRECDDLPKEFWSHEKNYPFSAVILNCSDWSAFLKTGQPDQVFKWNGKNVGRIRMPANGWDLLVKEN